MPSNANISTLWYPLNIPTPTPAPDRGGPVACLGGPVAWWDLWQPVDTCDNPKKDKNKLIISFLNYSCGKLVERIGLKLWGIILLRFSLITFRFAYGGASKPSFLWFRDFWTCPRLPKPILFIFADTRILNKNQQKSQGHFLTSMLYESRCF